MRRAALLDDERIVVVGSTAAYPYDMGVARYESNGATDGSFGVAGTQTVDFGFADYARAIVVADDGKITMIGTQFGADSPDVLLARLTPGGALDDTFGAAGKRAVDVPDRFIPEAAALDSAGGLLLVGQLQRYPLLLGAVVRLDTAGALDTSFGDGGIVVVPSSGYMADIAVRDDGSIVVAGSAGTVTADFVLALLSPTGSFDPSFGSGGVHTLDFFGEEDAVTALSLGPGGTALVAGRADTMSYYWQTNFDLAFARYRLGADTTPPKVSVPADITMNATTPAGAPVPFTATATDGVDGSVGVTCAPPSGSTFSIGTTTVSCSASDSSGNTASGSFIVRVKGAADQIADLIALVDGYHLGKLGTSLRDKLVAAQRFFAAGKNRQAEDNLSSFIAQVNAQRGKGLTRAQADALKAAAQRIIDVIVS